MVLFLLIIVTVVVVVAVVAAVAVIRFFFFFDLQGVNMILNAGSRIDGSGGSGCRCFTLTSILCQKR